MKRVLLCDFWGVLLSARYSLLTPTKLFALQAQPPSVVFDALYQFNTELLDFVNNLAKSTVKLVYSNSDLMLTHTRVVPQLTPIFDEILSAKNLHLPKNDPQSYHNLAKQYKCQISDLLLLDDNSYNTSAALASGAQAILHRDNAESFAILASFFDPQPQLSSSAIS